MATLAAKADVLREQLGLSPAMPIAQVIAHGIAELGLESSTGKLNLVGKADACLEVIGVHPASLSVGAAPVAPLAPTMNVVVATPIGLPMMPNINGTYNGPEGFRYDISNANQNGDTVLAKIFKSGRNLNISFEMRYAFADNLWMGRLPRHVHGGADIRWVFETDLSSFTSSASGKPTRRFTKRADAPAPIQPVAARPSNPQGVNGGLWDRGVHPNGGPRDDQLLPVLTVCCAGPFALCPLECMAAWGCTEAVGCVSSLPGSQYLCCLPCSANVRNPLWFCSQPLGWAASHGQLHTVMALVANGGDPHACNLAGFNAFTDAERERHQHVLSWLRQWESAGKPTPGFRAMPKQPKRADGLISTAELEGCWACTCVPLMATAVFHKRATGPDSLLHEGCLLWPLPIPFKEHRTRQAGTNAFYKNDEPGNLDVHPSRSCVTNGPSCSLKLCGC